MRHCSLYGGKRNILEHFKIKILLFLAVLLALVLAVESPIFATADDSIKKVQDEIANKQNRISHLEDQEASLLPDLVALETKAHQNRQELDRLHSELNSTRSELAKIHESIENAQQDLSQKKGTLKTRLAHIYRESRFINLDYILSCKDITTLLSRLDYLNLIAKQDTDLVQKVESEKHYLEQAEIRMEREKRSLFELESNCETKRAELNRTKSEKEALLETIKNQHLESEESLKDLQAKAIQIRTKMNKLQPASSSTPPSRATTRGSMRMLASAYCPCSRCCGKSSGTTATGLPAGKGVIAVDPKVIPLGTKLYVSEYGEAIAGDIGGKIKGNRIDLGFASHSQAMAWGKRWVVVDILD